MSSAQTDRSFPNRIAENLALDLANTISLRGTAGEVDHLADTNAVIDWAKTVGLIEADHRMSRARRATLLAEVHRLRAAIDAVGSAIALGSTPQASDLAIIHEQAAATFSRASLVGLPARTRFARDDGVIGPIAWAAVELLNGEDLHRLKRCPPDDCRWLFIDRTKNGSRRWCEMATCGNRAKTRARR